MRRSPFLDFTLLDSQHHADFHVIRLALLSWHEQVDNVIHNGVGLDQHQLAA
ncbi:hypothetical protein [Pseudomonas sp. OIL-1]|uniref:hypothetical protein n=1 Tax=Pseudomonas sp. OIL-1 TaxID=2706126 RepID=UPI0013A75519|nr:hypothetical protein [Pseudomonas sp. OIL-1]QIB51422.1 hypothetical protein G3M63_10425 [Pseudomonas sp. OIL-1]